MPKTSTEKAILSPNGQSEVLKKMTTLRMGNKSIDLCRRINKYFFQQIFPDISVDREIKLEQLEKESLESLLGVSLEEKDFTFTLKQLPSNPTIEKLLGANLFKNGFSPDVVEKFYNMIPIKPKTFKSLCKFLGLTYNEVVENTQNVNLPTIEFTLQDVLVSKFNHNGERKHLNNRLAHYNQRLAVLYKGIDILSLKWYLLRCLSKDCLTSANEIALPFTFKNPISQKKQPTNNELIDKLFENLLEKIKNTSIQIKSEIVSIKKLDGLKKEISFQRMNDEIKRICRTSGFLKYAKIDDAVKSISDQSLPATTITNITQAIQETKHSLIAQALAKVLSQQNVVLIFELEQYGQAIFSIKSLFWDKLVEYLSAESDTDYNLLFLVKGHSNQLDDQIYQSFQDFEKILPKPYFCWDNVRDWLSDPEVKTGLKLEDLEDQTAIDKKTEMIWEEAEREGQPEPLLKAIYKNFTNKETETWDVEKTKWVSL